MSVATVRTEQRVLLHDISWEFYEKFLDELSNRPIRLTYDQGDLEIMTPISREHEHPKSVIGRMIETLTEELNIPISSGGSTTLKQHLLKKGLEPDESYFINNEPLVRGREKYDLEKDPPPDLVVEVDVTSSSINRMKIYASFGVPEVWRFRDNTLILNVLQEDETYSETKQSVCFPFLPFDEFADFLHRRNETDETTWIRSFRKWVRERLSDASTDSDG